MPLCVFDNVHNWRVYFVRERSQVRRRHTEAEDLICKRHIVSHAADKDESTDNLEHSLKLEQQACHGLLIHFLPDSFDRCGKLVCYQLSPSPSSLESQKSLVTAISHIDKLTNEFFIPGPATVSRREESSTAGRHQRDAAAPCVASRPRLRPARRTAGHSPIDNCTNMQGARKQKDAVVVRTSMTRKREDALNTWTRKKPSRAEATPSSLG